MSIEDYPEPIRAYVANKMSRDWGDPGVNRVSLSELLGCQRKAYYGRRDPLPVAMKGQFSMFHGIVFDDLYIRLFPRNQVRVTHRLSDRDLTISGRLDFIDTDGAVADWKTTDNLYFIEQYGAKDDHIKQVQFYCYCEAVTKGRLYYQSLGKLVKIEVDASPMAQISNLRDLEDKARALQDALVCNLTPPVLDKPTWECCYGKGEDKTYCQYYERCYDGKEVQE